MKNLHRFLAIATLTIFTTSQAFAAGISIISRSGWKADESLRYLENNDKEIGTSDEDKDFYDEKNKNYKKVVTKNSKGKEYKWPLQYTKKVERFIIHHTASSNDPKDPMASIRSIYYYHAITRGWGDIGYNYIIDQNGKVYEGRAGGAGIIGGHAWGANNGSIGIALLGNFEEKKPSKKAINALAELISKKSKEFNIDPKGHSMLNGVKEPNVMGHRDAGKTACPGDYLYEQLPAIRKLAAKTYDQKEKFKKDYDFEENSDLYFLELNPGETKEVTVKFENVGKVTWDSNTYILVDSNPAFDKVISFPEKVEYSLAKVKEKSVKPGATGTFTFKVKGDTKPDTVEMKIAIMANGKTKIANYFRLPVVLNQSEFKYQLVESNFPPATMQPGEAFEGYVKLKNTGNATWNKAGTNVVFLATDRERTRNSLFVTPPGKKLGVLQEISVKPGETGTFTMSLKAPMTKGLYKEYFTPVVDWTTYMTDMGMNFETLVGADTFGGEVISQSTTKRWQRGESYNMWINLRNMGATTWTSKDIQLIFTKEEDLKVSNAKMINESLGPGKTGRIQFTVTVDPNDTLGKKALLIRPMIDGNYIIATPIKFEYTTVITDGSDIDKRRKIMVDNNGNPIDGGSTNTTKTTTTKTTTTKTKTTSSSKVKEGNGTEGDIRIKLTFSGSPEITASGDYEVKSGSTSVGEFTKNDIVKVENSDGKYKITAGSKTYTKSGPIRFIPDDGSILKVNNFTRTDNEFREILEVNIVDDELVLINELGLENYMKGLAEEPNDANAEMIKTIAVAARSYAKYYMDKAAKFPGKPYNLEDSPVTSQKYLGYTFEKRAPNVVKAVEATKGQMVTYKGALVKTPYFSKSDGTFTKSYKSVWGGSEVPYLVPVDDSYCKSTAFAGHGVGLSGCGAAAMADKGFKYVEILKYYYTGVEVTDFY